MNFPSYTLKIILFGFTLIAFEINTSYSDCLKLEGLPSKDSLSFDDQLLDHYVDKYFLLLSPFLKERFKEKFKLPLKPTYTCVKRDGVASLEDTTPIIDGNNVITFMDENMKSKEISTETKLRIVKMNVDKLLSDSEFDSKSMKDIEKCWKRLELINKSFMSFVEGIRKFNPAYYQRKKNVLEHIKTMSLGRHTQNSAAWSLTPVKVDLIKIILNGVNDEIASFGPIDKMLYSKEFKALQNIREKLISLSESMGRKGIVSAEHISLDKEWDGKWHRVEVMETSF